MFPPIAKRNLNYDNVKIFNSDTVFQMIILIMHLYHWNQQHWAQNMSSQATMSPPTDSNKNYKSYTMLMCYAVRKVFGVHDSHSWWISNQWYCPKSILCADVNIYNPISDRIITFNIIKQNYKELCHIWLGSLFSNSNSSVLISLSHFLFQNIL